MRTIGLSKVWKAWWVIKCRTVATFTAFTRKLHSRCAIHGLFMRCRNPWGQTPLEPKFLQETWRNYCEYRFKVVWNWKAQGSRSVPARRICLASCVTEWIIFGTMKCSLHGNKRLKWATRFCLEAWKLLIVCSLLNTNFAVYWIPYITRAFRLRMHGHSFRNSEGYGKVAFFINLIGIGLENELAQIGVVVIEPASFIEEVTS